jgi:L-iditol 2-dehydrogenase
MIRMKAAVVCANEDVQYLDYEEPVPGPGEVKVKVAASGICGSDVPRVLYNGVHFYPIVLGHEFSGDVVEVGEGVTKVKVGDRVSGAPLLPCRKCDDCQDGNYSLCKNYSFIGSRQQGSNADFIVLPEQNAVVFDKSVSYEQGAMFEPSTVALHGLLQSDYQGGQYVAILGGGTIGMFAMQWAKILGSKKVVVFDISQERLDLAMRLGADEVIDTTKDNYMEKAMAITDGRGYAYVYETAGQPPTMYMAFELAANKANVCFIGTPHVELTFTQAMWENMNRKEFMLTGSWMSYSSPFPGKEWELTAYYYSTGQLKFDPGIVYKKIPMSRAQEAFQMFKTPGLVKGKVLLVNEDMVQGNE